MWLFCFVYLFLPLFFISSFAVYSVGAFAEEKKEEKEEEEDDDDDDDDSLKNTRLSLSDAKSLALGHNPDYKWNEITFAVGREGTDQKTLKEWEEGCLIYDDDTGCTEETEDEDCKGGEICVEGQCVPADEQEPTGLGPCDPNALALWWPGRCSNS